MSLTKSVPRRYADRIVDLCIGGHPDLEIMLNLITVAGQRQLFTELSPLRLMTDPHQNRNNYLNLAQD